MKLSDYVMEFVADQGVRHVFLIPGGGCMHLVDALGRCRRLEFVCNLHEQACAVAADAYAQYTNNLGVALVTTGPGGTNTITGVAGAWLDSTPCLFLSGQVKRADLTGTRGVRQMGFQEIDIVRMVAGITKYAVTVTDPETIRYHLEKAVYLAKHGRPGPVWIDIPLDIQALPIDPERQRGYEGDETFLPFDIKQFEEQVDCVVRCFNQAERPVILAGNGIRLAGALPEFHEIIDILQAPVLTTWKAIDFLEETHPQFVGRPGAVGQRGANFTQQNSDFLLVIGARLDAGQTGYNHRNFARAARKVVVDIDAAEINKMDMPLEAGICADAGLFLRALRAKVGLLVRRDRSAWLARCKEWQARYPVLLPEYWKQDGVNNYALVEVLSREMAPTDLLVPGSSGACSEVTMQAFQVQKGMRIFNTEGLGPMGFGVPAALGGCLASGGRRTVCIDGDGGFQMNCQELETIHRLGLPVKFFVLNNNGYASIRTTQNGYFDGRFVASDPRKGVDLCLIHGKWLSAYGVPTVLISNHEHLITKVREVLDRPGPVLAEVQVSPAQHTSPKLSSAQRPDGSFVSRPLEDLWPFLERDEFRANMIIPPLED